MRVFWAFGAILWILGALVLIALLGRSSDALGDWLHRGILAVYALAGVIISNAAAKRRGLTDVVKLRRLVKLCLTLAFAGLGFELLARVLYLGFGVSLLALIDLVLLGTAIAAWRKLRV